MSRTRSAAIFLSLAMVISLGACSASNPLVGDWNAEVSENAAISEVEVNLQDVRNQQKCDFAFTDAGKVGVMIKTGGGQIAFLCDYKTENGELTITYNDEKLLSGTYSIDGGKVTYNLENGGKLVLARVEASE